MVYKRHHYHRTFATLALFAAIFLTGCGSGTGTEIGGGDDNASDVKVVISPKAATVAPGGQRQFTATVQNSGGANGVTWAILEGAAGGTIDQNGLYTAPSTPGAYHVVVSSQVFTSKFDSAAVTVQ